MTTRVTLKMDMSGGVHDEVICYSCGLWLAEWESNEYPLVVHAYHSPKCAFLNKTLSSSGINEIQKQWRQIFKPKFPLMEDLQKRVETFCNISNCTGNHTSESIAQAGFFADVNDTLILLVCYYCGVRIIPWKCNVDPWEMHIRWCQNCKFVETRTGKKFISTVYNRYKDAQEKVRHQYDNHMVSFDDEEVRCTRGEILQGVCVKCKKKKVTTVFVDCGHRITCLDCAFKYSRCPYCSTCKKKTKTPVEAFH